MAIGETVVSSISACRAILAVLKWENPTHFSARCGGYRENALDELSAPTVPSALTTYTHAMLSYSARVLSHTRLYAVSRGECSCSPHKFSPIGRLDNVYC